MCFCIIVIQFLTTSTLNGGSPAAVIGAGFLGEKYIKLNYEKSQIAQKNKKAIHKEKR